MRTALKREEAAEYRLHFSHRRVRVILASFIACHFEEKLILEILAALRRRHKRPALQNADLLAALNRWFAALPETVLSRLVNPESVKQKRVCRDAVKLVAAARCLAWVQQENFVRGVAPSQTSLVERYGVEVVALGERAPTLTASSARRWARKWRKLFHVSFAQLPCRDSQCEEKMEQKVAWP